MFPPLRLWISWFVLFALGGLVVFSDQWGSTWQLFGRAWQSATDDSVGKIISAILTGGFYLAAIIFKFTHRRGTTRNLLLRIFRLKHILAATTWLLFFSYQVYKVAASTFTLTDLGTLGGSTSVAIDINNSGQVVGWSQIPGDPASSQHAFLWKGGVLGNRGTMTDLGTLSGEQYSYANGINNSGQVVGYSGTTATNDRAFLYSNRVMTELGTLGGTESRASAINNGGQVVGLSHITGNAAVHAFLYEGGSMSDLGTLGGDRSEAIAINNSAQVVGDSWTTGNAETRAFLFDDGSMTDLGTLGGDHSGARDINDKGQVVGTSHLAGNVAGHAFLYNGSAMRDLDTLGGSSSQPSGINNRGQVVGSTLIAGKLHAFLWDDANGMMDINPAGWSSSWASSINDHGRIVGQGKSLDGLEHGFLLTPVSALPALLLLGSALAALVCLGRKTLYSKT